MITDTSAHRISQFTEILLFLMWVPFYTYTPYRADKTSGRELSCPYETHLFTLIEPNVDWISTVSRRNFAPWSFANCEIL